MADLADWEVRVPLGARGDRRAIEIPVRYDGPDLADVAALWGVTPSRGGAHPRGTEFRVAFCGFAPGFGYLTGLPGALPRAAPGHPADVGPGRLRWRSRARTPASTRAPRRAAGS